MLLIGETLKKDIKRNINGVVKAENNREDVVLNELEEYVVTEEVRQHMAKLFDRYSDSINNSTEDMGIWISGFFGSGKSHLLKMLGHIVDNKEYNGITASKYFDEKVKDHILQGNIEKSSSKNTDVILFNIDNVSDQDTNQNKDSIVLAFQKKFNDYLGFSRDDIKLASLERRLWELGVFEDFKEEYEEISGAPWIEERRNIHFIAEDFLDTIEEMDIKGFPREAAERWLEDDKEESVNSESFCDYIESYLKLKGKDHRILFLVDEIGQYIGDNLNLMLNLQTIVENLGVKFGGRVWVGVTSQQDIDGLLKDSNTKRVDFAKIQGRFKTMLSLSSGNIDEVIKKRLLEKRDIEKAELEKMYDERRVDINNLISFSKEGVTQKLYDDKVDFSETYPFVGYQFSLLQKVLDKVRNMGHSGKHMSRGERSLLSAFQEAGIKMSDEKLGALVPFDYFFSSIEQFLEDTARRPFIHAKNEKRCSEDDLRVLRLLFLLKGIDDTVAPTLENLTSFMVDSIDCNKVELEKRIKTSLRHLEKQVLIQRDHDKYYFLTNEEQDINREIDQENVDIKEEYKIMDSIIFEDIFVGKGITVEETGNSYDFNRSIDDEKFGKPGNPLDIAIWSPRGDSYGSEVLLGARPENNLIIKLPQDTTYFEEIRLYKKIDMYFKKSVRSNQRENIQRIIESKQRENKNRYRRVVELIKAAIGESEVFIAGNKIDIKGMDPKSKIGKALEAAAKQRFKMAGLVVKKYTTNSIYDLLQYTFDKNTQLIKINQDLESNVNKGAITEVKNRIELEKQRGKVVVVSNLVEYFTKEPYGWEPLTVNGIVAELWVYKLVDITESSVKLVDSKEVGKLLEKSQTKTLERIVVSPKEEIDVNLIKKVEKLTKECFGPTSVISNDAPVEDLMAIIKVKIAEASGHKNECERNNFPGKKITVEWLDVLKDISSIGGSGEKVLKEFLKSQDDLEEAYEEYSKVADFYNSPKKEKFIVGQKKIAEIERYEDYVGKIKESDDYIKLVEILEARDPFNKIRLIDDHILKIEELELAIVKEEIGELKDEADRSIEKFKGTIGAREGLLVLASKKILEFKEDLEKNMSIQTLTKGKKLENIIDDIVAKYKKDIREEILDLKSEVKKELVDKEETEALETRVDKDFDMILNRLVKCNFENIEYQLEIARSEKDQFISEAQGKSKKKERISIRKIVAAPEYNLESQEEVESYINKLEVELQEMKEKMMEAIRENKIVDIK